ncbi:MAG: alpha-L-glutamate ligase [Chromatiales bacterium 21-64-14]|nr:MAG: alpha-L-glutamate ligase [Chromatiales bacterium 21-64-14]HQU15267.1 hypothetical protein [Gammaproteobacteria bacterium]
MQLVSFNALRSLGIEGVRYIKPELIFQHREEVRHSRWVLFPEYWQVNALVYGLHKRIFPSVSSYHLGHDKVEMTRAFLAVCPDHVPHTRILPATEGAIDQVLEEFDFPFVAKEVRSAMGDGVFLVDSRAQFLEYARRNPVLYVQEYLPIHRDLRVVYVGDRVIAAYWRIGPQGGFQNNVARGGRIDFTGVPTAAIRLVEDLAASLGVDHAGFDLAQVGKHFYLLEFNTLFGNYGLVQKHVQLGSIIQAYLQKSELPPLHPDNTLLPRAS